MAHPESRELASARELLAEFERDAASPEAIARLSEALSFLADLIDGGGAEAHVAKNIAGVYAAKVAALADAVLDKEGEPSLAEIRHWKELLEEFGRSGVDSPVAAAEAAKLSKRAATRYVGQLTPGEKEHLLKQLEQDEAARRGRK